MYVVLELWLSMVRIVVVCGVVRGSFFPPIAGCSGWWVSQVIRFHRFLWLTQGGLVDLLVFLCSCSLQIVPYFLVCSLGGPSPDLVMSAVNISLTVPCAPILPVLYKTQAVLDALTKSPCTRLSFGLKLNTIFCDYY